MSEGRIRAWCPKCAVAEGRVRAARGRVYAEIIFERAEAERNAQ